MSWVKVWEYEKYVKVTQLRASRSLRQNLFYTIQEQIPLFAGHNITSQKESGFYRH